MHRHPVVNAGVVLQGELTVVAENGLSKTFSAGSGIVELVNTFHYGENRGTVPVDLAMFYAGGEDLPLSVKRYETALKFSSGPFYVCFGTPGRGPDTDFR